RTDGVCMRRWAILLLTSMADLLLTIRFFRSEEATGSQSLEFFRTLQRYYSNAYLDAQKQSAINVFLGHVQPKQNQAEAPELYVDQ
ncbi:hypothetical protein M569_07427, partial [Genlisea aurea]